MDHKPELEEQCKPTCTKFAVAYEACVTRIASDTTGEAHCTGQYFDNLDCIDKCVSAPPSLVTRYSRLPACQPLFCLQWEICLLRVKSLIAPGC